MILRLESLYLIIISLTLLMMTSMMRSLTMIFLQKKVLELMVLF